MALREYLNVDIIEKEPFRIDIAEKEILSCKLTVLDILQYREKAVVSGLIQEVPIKLTPTKFQTSQAFVTGSLKVFLNGVKIKIADITEVTTQIFTIVDSTITEDLIEVEFLEPTLEG